MITEEERQSIIEEVLLKIPEVVGNMMVQHVLRNKINTKFYKDHPEFRERPDVVAAVVEMIQGNEPLLEHEEILKKAIPEISKQLKIHKSLNTQSVSTSSNGAI